MRTMIFWGMQYLFPIDFNGLFGYGAANSPAASQGMMCRATGGAEGETLGCPYGGADGPPSFDKNNGGPLGEMFWLSP